MTDPLRKTFRILQLLIVLNVLLLAHIARAQSSPDDCTGQTNEPIHEGGAQNTLLYKSLERDVGKARFIYEATVTSHLNGVIEDVDWPVASYFRKYLQPGFPDCSNTDVIGESESKTGPLTWSAGSGNTMPTTAYKPKAGWNGLVATSRELAAPLKSQLRITVRVRDDYKVNVLNIESAVRVKGFSEFEYIYSFKNSGDSPLLVFWDIPRTPEFAKFIKMDLEHLVKVTSGDLKPFIVQSKEPPASGPSIISVYSEEHQLLAKQIVGVFGFASGEPTFNLEAGWNRQQ